MKDNALVQDELKTAITYLRDSLSHNTIDDFSVTNKRDQVLQGKCAFPRSQSPRPTKCYPELENHRKHGVGQDVATSLHEDNEGSKCQPNVQIG